MKITYLVAEGYEAKESIDHNQLEASQPASSLSLREQLQNMILTAKSDPQFAAQEHYILFKLNAHKAMIKADLNGSPVFWITNLDRGIDGGPKRALQGEKDMLSEFGEYHDLYTFKLEERDKRVAETLERVHFVFPKYTEETAINELSLQKRGQVPVPLKVESIAHAPTSNFAKTSATLFSHTSHKVEKAETPEKKVDVQNESTLKPK